MGATYSRGAPLMGDHTLMADEYEVPDDLTTNVWRSEVNPGDRLSRIAGSMLDVLAAEAGGELRCIVMLGDERRGVLVHDGYEDDAAAIADTVAHLDAFLKSLPTPAKITISPR